MASSPCRGDLRSPCLMYAATGGQPRVAPTAFIAVLLIFVLAACAPAPRATTPTTPLSPLPAPAQTPAPTPTPGPLALTIVHSNDSWGYLDPCG